MPVRVVTDSVACLLDSEAQALGLDVVDLYVNDGQSNLPDRQIDLGAFYRRLADSKTLPTSSQPSVESLRGDIHGCGFQRTRCRGVFISSKMSGTVETALMAARMVLQTAPQARIEIVDSMSNSLQEGFCAMAAAREAQTGGAVEEAPRPPWRP